MGTNQRRRRRTIQQLIFVAIIAVLAVFGLYHFFKWREELALGRVYFRLPAGHQTAPFKVEVARSDAERKMGLMYRRELEPDRGMLFVYPEESDHSIWMRNTYIPLDLVFIAADMKVLGVIENVPVLNEEPRSIGKPSKYILEVNAGAVRRHGIVEGASAVIEEAATER